MLTSGIARSRALIAWTGFLLLLLGWDLIIFGPLLAHPGSRVFADNDDSSLFVFWFAHAADVAAGWLGMDHLEANALYTTALNYPIGVNGGWNTTVFLIALPLAPVTWLWGPLAAYNLAIAAAPVLCALAAAALAAQFLPRFWSFTAGFFYGFSTFVIAQSSGHLNLSSAVLAPLVGLGLIRLLRARRHRAVLGWSVFLGIIIGWQFYISTEVLAGTFLAYCAVVAVWLCCDFRRLWAARRRLCGGLVLAAAIALAIGTPLLATMFGLPGAPRGAIRPHGVWNADLLDPVVPGRYTLLGGGETPIPRVTGLDPSEIGGYLGIPWLMIIALGTLVLWRNRVYGRPVRILALSTVLVFLLSMGSPLFAWGRAMAPGPFGLVEALPVLGNVLPMRLAGPVALGAALLLAIYLRGLWHLGARWSRPYWARGLTTAGLVAVLVTTTSGPVPVRTPLIPEFFRAGAGAVPQGAVVKILPRPVAGDQAGVAEAMLWQAEAGNRFRQTGGYFIGGDSQAPIRYMADSDALDGLLDESRDHGLPSGDSAEMRRAVAELRARGVQYVLLVADSPYRPWDVPELAGAMSQAVGRQARADGGVYIVDIR